MIFLLGSSFYSFLFVLVLRLQRHEDFVYKRSYCFSCHHVLSFYDLIPIWSYILFNGKCRYCHQKIPRTYFIVEAIGGTLALLCFIYYPSYQACFLFMFISLGLLMSVIDILEQHIYLFSLRAFALINIVYSLYDVLSLKEHLWGVLLPYLFLKACRYLIKDSFGDGDIDLWMILGGMLGIKCLIYAFIGSIYLATLYALYLRFFKKDTLTKTIPYVPFMMLSSLLTLLLLRI